MIKPFTIHYRHWWYRLIPKYRKYSKLMEILMNSVQFQQAYDDAVRQAFIEGIGYVKLEWED